jgi:hypothetical protein
MGVLYPSERARPRDLLRIRPARSSTGRKVLHQFMLEEPAQAEETVDDAAPAPAPAPILAPRRLKAHGLSVTLGRTPTGEEVMWNSADQMNPFLFACGASGSGKTELLKLFAGSARMARIPVLLFDVHGDLALPGLPSYAVGRRGYSVNPLGCPVSLADQAPSLCAAPIVEAARLGRVQATSLREVLESLWARARSARQAPQIGELRKALAERSGSSAEGLSAAVSTLYDEEAFGGRELPIEQLLRTGAHINLTALAGNPRVQMLAVQALLVRVWAEMQARGPMGGEVGALRVLVVVDEAARVGSAVVDRLVREARKFGLGLLIAAQLPGDVSDAVRSNAGTAVVLRLQGAAAWREAAELLGSVKADRVAELRGRGDAWVRDASGVHRVQLRRAQDD